MTAIIGIDLGTTHCAVASVDPAAGKEAPIRELLIPQVVRPGEVTARPLLPSVLYAPVEAEGDPAAGQLPWAAEGTWTAGEYARWQGARVPGRVVASAKSWLCHPGVDRGAAILPWGAPPEVPRLSPVEASARLLKHLRAAWDAAHPDLPMSAQEVVLTVPASFDEVARALTVNAARAAGLQKFTLVEEPQAAFYDFTARHRKNLAQAVEALKLVLVVDVGGGTSDFTLIQAALSPEGPLLRRIAVGDHLLLGGDNMDAALARRAEEKLTLAGKRLGASQWTQLVQAARVAKEALLGEAPPERYGLAIAGAGSKLLGGTLSTELEKAEVESLLLDGFFPQEAPTSTPRRAARMGLQELGLPYAQDPAITRHLAEFLRVHAEAAFKALGIPRPSPDALPRPDAILLNGGVFNSPAIARRLQEALSAWWPESERIPLLDHPSLELAVARGAAYYGLVRRGLGLKIGGGAARAYYVTLAREDGTSAALCLVPRGLEEGQSTELTERTFSLTLGRPVQFTLHSTTADRVDKPGEVVELTSELHPLPPLHTLLRSQRAAGGKLQVTLRAGLTEIGTLELWCRDTASDEQWRLEFELRGTSGSGPLAVTEAMPARFTEATELVGRIYGNKPLPMGPRDVKQLLKNLERVLGAKDTWRVPVLRELWSTALAGATKRRRSEDHERVFFQLAGFALRPGFGYPLDGWRAEQLFALFKDGVQFHPEKANWNEFWVMWRRIAGGLNEDAQRTLYASLRPQLEQKVPPDAPKPSGKPKGIQPEGLEEMVRTAASLEHLDPEEKEQLGGWIARRLRWNAEQKLRGGPWPWALGRIGARVPLYGSIHRTVSAQTAEEWISLLLEAGLANLDGGAFAVTQLARRTGDRTRDVEEATRQRVQDALSAQKAPEGWLRMVREVVALEAADEARALGDTLPAGLTLA